MLASDELGTARDDALKVAKFVGAFDADIRAALDSLAGHINCTGRIGTMDVCVGGHLAFRSALNPSVLAKACFYATDIHSGSLGEGTADDNLAP